MIVGLRKPGEPNARLRSTTSTVTTCWLWNCGGYLSARGD
jgi:hypothetical protein